VLLSEHDPQLHLYNLGYDVVTASEIDTTRLPNYDRKNMTRKPVILVV